MSAAKRKAPARKRAPGKTGLARAAASLADFERKRKDAQRKGDGPNDHHMEGKKVKPGLGDANAKPKRAISHRTRVEDPVEAAYRDGYQHGFEHGTAEPAETYHEGMGTQPEGSMLGAVDNVLAAAPVDEDGPSLPAGIRGGKFDGRLETLARSRNNIKSESQPESLGLLGSAKQGVQDAISHVRHLIEVVEALADKHTGGGEKSETSVPPMGPGSAGSGYDLNAIIGHLNGRLGDLHDQVKRLGVL